MVEKGVGGVGAGAGGGVGAGGGGGAPGGGGGERAVVAVQEGKSVVGGPTGGRGGRPVGIRMVSAEKIGRGLQGLGLGLGDEGRRRAGSLE